MSVLDEVSFPNYENFDDENDAYSNVFVKLTEVMEQRGAY